MPLIQFPNVPNVPGVPAILRSITVPTPGALLNSAISGIVDAIFGPTVWGIFDKGGKAALSPDAFLGIDYRNEARVSNYPQEKGAFASYNKVQTPFDCRVKLTISGDKASRTKFLATCDAMVKSLDLFTVITPEVSYASASLQSYDYRRDDKNGVSMLTVDLDFTEVRITVASQSAATSQPAVPPIAAPKLPSAASILSGGQVQTFPVRLASIVGRAL